MVALQVRKPTCWHTLSTAKLSTFTSVMADMENRSLFLFRFAKVRVDGTVRSPITVASLVSGKVAALYNEGSEVIVTGDVILAASPRLKATINPSTTTTTTTEPTITTSSMDTSGDSSLDAANGTAASVAAIASVVGSAASLTIKAERPDLAGTSTSPALAAGPISTGSSLFTGIANSNKTTRPDDWLATNSPESPQSSLQSQHVVYTSGSQQLSEPPVAHSSPHQQVSNNGYASPMSTGSYDPYSPNGKIDKQMAPMSLLNYHNLQNS
ncbi:Ecdysone receptor [Camponotus floridanus]|uniref:Ecdysone receptor n=1 Tax=Camponotus floridanus TaxID=104421 RepID=E2ACZ7_CAMFO|nr:Ecdysone receptor [Camponotus floridanus]